MYNVNTFQSAGAATEKVRSPLHGTVGACFERNVDDVGTGKGLTCLLYIQEPVQCFIDINTLYCIVLCILQAFNEGISIQAFLISFFGVCQNSCSSILDILKTSNQGFTYA